MRQEKIRIQGMHCVSCEILLEKELKKISGLKSCKVSHKKGEADIMCDEAVSLDAIEKAVKKCGYQITQNDEAVSAIHHKNTAEDYVQIVMIAIGFIGLVFIMKQMDITRLFPNVGAQANVMAALLLGVVASLSTCLALTGGIVMGFGAMVKTEEGKNNHLLSRAIPHIYFHIGRVGGFMILGGLLGLLGSKINYSLTFTGYLTILIAVVMLYIGLQILNIAPNITRLGFHLPKVFSSKIDSLQAADHHFAPMLIGVLTFFLPCGFTQSMQLAAVASQNFFTGALIMGAFAVGTLPVLIAVGIGSTYAHADKMKLLYRFIGVVIVFFGLYSLNSGLVLTGSPVTLKFWKTGAGAISANQTADAVQVVKMDVDWVFSPNEFKVKKGVPVRWEINGINVSGCSNEIVIPKLNIRKEIQNGLNTVEFTPDKTGTLPFSCWMGMLTGRFIVTD